MDTASGPLAAESVKTPRRQWFSGRNRQLAAAAVVLLGAAAVAVPLAGSAQAQPSTVMVPLHDSPTQSLMVVGATDDAMLVSRDATNGEGQNFFSNTKGGLDALGTLFPYNPTTGHYYYIVGVVGKKLAWYEYVPKTSSSPVKYTLHQVDLGSGNSISEQDVPTPPVAYTGDGWLSYSKGTPGTNSGDLVRNLFDGPATTLIKNAPSPVITMTATATGALLTSYQTPTSGLGHYRLDRIDFGSGSTPATVERIADVTDEISSADLSDTTVAWATRPQGNVTPTVIHQRPLAGGDTETYSDSSRSLHDSRVQAGHGQAAYIVADPAAPALRIVTGSTARTVALPGFAETVGTTTTGANLYATSDSYITAVSGPLAVAGVYAIAQDGDKAVRMDTVPDSQIPVKAIALSAGRVYYADGAKIDKPGLSVWSRAVTGTFPPSVGSESLLPQRARQLDDASSQSLSFSAGRGSSGDPASERLYQLLDRGKVTATIPATPYDPEEEQTRNHPNTSGPYTLAEGKVYTPDGKLVYTRPGAASFQFVNDDLYGSTLIWADTNSKTGKSTIWVRDVAKAKSSTNPLKLATTACHPTLCPQLVSIWGNRVAWTTDKTHIATRTIGATTTRKVTSPQPVTQLELGESVLAWQIGSGNTTRLLDLTNTKSTVYVMPGSATRIALDGHYLARTVTDNRQVVVYRLPFTAKQHPRLIGRFAPAGFTPNHDGKADTWAPQFDASKPLTGVTLKITAAKSGKVFRTLTGTAPDGSIRDLSWDGLTSGGKALPLGTYNWTLTGAAADGEGDLISPGGKTVITGTVKITAT
jgi:hypothetical protein